MYYVYHLWIHTKDGIREGHVTGVQTCALPIFKEDAYDIGALNIGEDGLPREGDSELSAYETGSCLIAGLAAKQAYANKPYHFTLKHILSNTSYEISQVNIIDLSSQDQWVVLPERETEVIFTETGNRYFKIQVQFNNRETSSFIFF